MTDRASPFFNIIGNVIYCNVKFITNARTLLIDINDVRCHDVCKTYSHEARPIPLFISRFFCTYMRTLITCALLITLLEVI